jgi:cell division protein FtsB
LIEDVSLVNLRRFISALYLTLIVGIGLAGGLYFIEAREEYGRLKTIQAESRRRVAEAEVRLKYQEQVLERLRTDPAYVEKVIRRKLGYARPEEYVFRFEN